MTIAYRAKRRYNRLWEAGPARPNRPAARIEEYLHPRIHKWRRHSVPDPAETCGLFPDVSVRRAGLPPRECSGGVRIAENIPSPGIRTASKEKAQVWTLA